MTPIIIGGLDIITKGLVQGLKDFEIRDKGKNYILINIIITITATTNFAD